MSISTRILRPLVSLAILAGIGELCAQAPKVHSATAVLVLLLATFVIAYWLGFWEAFTATAVSAACLAYFFLPPAGWPIGSAQYWVVFLTFLAVALMTSYFVARSRSQTSEAVVDRRELEFLYAFGKDLPIEGRPGAMVAGSLDSLVRCFETDAAAFYDCVTGEMTRSGSKASSFTEHGLRAATEHSNLFREQATGSMFVPIRCGGRAIGSLAVRGGMSELTFAAIADRIEARLDKVHAQQELRHAEETRKSQELKTAVLDSLVHEVKTPLSVIKTAASSLLSRDSDPLSRRELLTIINGEADRMDASISDVFWTARLEAGAIGSGKGSNNLELLIKEALSELEPLLAGRLVNVEVPDSLPPATCDFYMIKGVVKELINNAAKYSPSGSPLTICVQRVGNEITTSVCDWGVGIASGEEKLIFAKHYRGQAPGPGTGMGLAIAKTIVEAHGGRIGIKRQPSGGSVFNFSLPVSHQDVA